MTKKDYIIIANALKPFYKDFDGTKYTQTEEESQMVVNIVTAISKALKADNPKFDSIKFLDYLRA